MADAGMMSSAARVIPSVVRMLFPRLPLNERQKIRDCLRRIYFTHDGSLSILKSIADGNIAKATDDHRLIEFSEAEADVDSAVHFLRQVVSNSGIEYSTEFLSYLDLVRYRKFEVRSELFEFLREYDSEDPEWRRKRANELVLAVNDLNNAILEIDQLL